MNQKKQERNALRFSYLDVFFLLLAGFILSIGIYFFSRGDQNGEVVPTYRVEATAHYDGRVYEAIPSAGETLFDENGVRIGEILKAETYQAEGKTQVLLEFRLRGKAPKPDGAVRIETAKSTNVATVLSVSEEEVGQ